MSSSATEHGHEAAPGPPRVRFSTATSSTRAFCTSCSGDVAHQERLLTLIWSEELLNEARQTLITGKQVSEAIADRWVGYLREAFPDQRVDIAQAQAEIDAAALANDPKDTHVCALAIAGKADADHGGPWLPARRTRSLRHQRDHARCSSQRGTRGRSRSRAQCIAVTSHCVGWRTADRRVARRDRTSPGHYGSRARRAGRTTFRLCSQPSRRPSRTRVDRFVSLPTCAAGGKRAVRFARAVLQSYAPWLSEASSSLRRLRPPRRCRPASWRSSRR